MLAVGIALAAPAGAANLTPTQKREIREIALTLDRSEQATKVALATDIVVPRLQRWDDAEVVYRRSLARLARSLPAGTCRSAVEALLAVEEAQGTLRRQMVAEYRREDFLKVNEVVVAYATSTDDREEEAVLGACGRSPADPTRTAVVSPALGPAQAARLDATQVAFTDTRTAFGRAFDLAKTVGALETVQAAEGSLIAEIAEATALLGPGPCRTALEAVIVLERRQFELRQAFIAAGTAGNLLEMNRLLAGYAAIDGASDQYRRARASASKACGIEL